MILDETQLRDGSGWELQHLHDVVQQHIRALKFMEQELSPSFITSIIELKLDRTLCSSGNDILSLRTRCHITERCWSSSIVMLKHQRFLHTIKGNLILTLPLESHWLILNQFRPLFPIVIHPILNACCARQRNTLYILLRNSGHYPMIGKLSLYW